MTYNENYRLPFILAVAFHLILLAFLFVHFASRSEQPAVQPSVNIIKAIAVNQSQLQNQLSQLQAAQQAKLQQQQAQQQAAQMQQQKIAQQQAAALKQKQEMAQEQALAAQQAKTQQVKAQQAKQEAVRKKLVAQEIQQQLVQQQAQTKQQPKQKQLQNAKFATQKLLQQEVTATDAEQQQSAQQSAANQGEIDKYKALILQAISSQWIVPQSVQDNEVGTLLVHLAPGGVVLSVEITQSSGDPALDRSARIAVLKASPLPVPSDNALFDRFRTISLTVKPQGITSGD